MSMIYVYGASVQGIQRFVFETGKLKEIAGGKIEKKNRIQKKPGMSGSQ
jgi:hypothetical protein